MKNFFFFTYDDNYMSVLFFRPSAPVFFLKYSHDGLLFASAGKVKYPLLYQSMK